MIKWQDTYATGSEPIDKQHRLLFDIFNDFEDHINDGRGKEYMEKCFPLLDAYAKAHPLVVEQEKDARLRGFYIHPELYGAPPEKQIEWARHPQMMKRMQEMRAKQLAGSQKQAAPRN